MSEIKKAKKTLNKKGKQKTRKKKDDTNQNRSRRQKTPDGFLIEFKPDNIKLNRQAELEEMWNDVRKKYNREKEHNKNPREIKKLSSQLETLATSIEKGNKNEKDQDPLTKLRRHVRRKLQEIDGKELKPDINDKNWKLTTQEKDLYDKYKTEIDAVKKQLAAGNIVVIGDKHSDSDPFDYATLLIKLSKMTQGQLMLEAPQELNAWTDKFNQKNIENIKTWNKAAFQNEYMSNAAITAKDLGWDVLAVDALNPKGKDWSKEVAPERQYLIGKMIDSALALAGGKIIVFGSAHIPGKGNLYPGSFAAWTGHKFAKDEEIETGDNQRVWVIDRTQEATKKKGYTEKEEKALKDNKPTRQLDALNKQEIAELDQWIIDNPEPKQDKVEELNKKFGLQLKESNKRKKELQKEGKVPWTKTWMDLRSQRPKIINDLKNGTTLDELSAKYEMRLDRGTLLSLKNRLTGDKFKDIRAAIENKMK